MNEFFAYMARLRLIRRWSLMRNTQPENDAEHSLQVAMIAHALALAGKARYHRSVDPEHAAVLAIYHDAAEVLTGDLPTPVKYHSGNLRESYAQVERAATEKLCSMLPETARDGIAGCLTEHSTLAARYVKAADKISAYIHCLEEQRAGNREFDAAAESVYRSILALAEDPEQPLPEISDFLRESIPAFTLTLDELNR